MKSKRLYYAKVNIVSGVLNNVVILGLSFILRLVIIDKIGIDYLGLNSLMISILQVLNLAEFGFSSSVVFSLYKPISENNTEEICSLLSFYRYIYKIVGIVILFLGIVVSFFLKFIIRDTSNLDVNIYIIFFVFLANSVVSYLLFGYKNVIFVASQRQNILNIVNSIVVVIKTIIQLEVLVIFKNYYLFTLLNPIFTCLENFCIALLTKKIYPELVCKGNISEEKKKDIIKQVKGLFIGQITKISRNSFDSIIIAFFCGLKIVGIYSNYFYIMNAVLGVFTIFVTSINAGVGDSVASEDIEKNYNDYVLIHYFFMMMASACFSCFIVLYQPFIKLWIGNRYLLDNCSMLLFSIYFYIICLGLARSVYSNAAGIWWETRYPQMFEMISNLILNFVLGYFFGIKGILFATIITMVIYCVFWQTRIVMRVYFDKSYLLYLKQSLLYIVFTAISCICVVFLSNWISTRNYYLLIFKGVYVFVISAIIYIALSIVNQDCRKIVKTLLMDIR